MSIVVGYATTDEGRAALQRAVAEARLRGTRLFVVDITGAGGRPGEVPAAGDLEEVRAQLQASGVEHEVVPRSEQGDPAEDIVGLATSASADLIVIGLRRRTPVGKLILGANAQRILLDAPCPVLAVKAAGPGASRP
jgi:nucleotide-binding universal stress UspA family protein